ncbi:M57 family metalloprotease [Echinicola jeungdonensis]|uniref:M57 family metalloprotease n=1 Tax=Echinicola jeungdonensis TaxID=709343 RepID=A0ABV5J6L5_9BACT|nr:M57 family metalloprotease [Echinicola jeungdonensis]MDN3669274.1 M57 family metalloprotease [Echinicola jeungdonensis]
MERNGFENAEVQLHRDGYLIDGCIFISEENLIERFEAVNNTPKKGGENLQTTVNNLVNYTTSTPRTVTFKFHSSVPLSTSEIFWRDAIREAMIEWSNVKNFALTFEETLSSNPEITFYGANLGGAVAEASWPSSGDPGSRITVNTSYNTTFSLNQLKFVMAHEIGHTLGFRHTNWEQDGESINNPATGMYGANLVSGTWNDDPYSIMNSGKYYPYVPTWNGFGFLDILAFRTIYPLDGNQKPFYVYRRLTNKGYYWTNDWSEYGNYTYESSTSTGYEYIGYNGFIYDTQISGTVPIYLYYSPGSDWYYKSKDPTIDTAFPGWNKIKIIGYAFASGGTGRQPVYEFYNPSKGFFFTLNSDNNLTSGPNWSNSGVAFYVNSIE